MVVWFSYLCQGGLLVFHVLLQSPHLCVQRVQLLGVEGPHAVLLVSIFLCVGAILMMCFTVWHVLKYMMMVLSCVGVCELVHVVHRVFSC